MSDVEGGGDGNGPTDNPYPAHKAVLQRELEALMRKISLVTGGDAAAMNQAAEHFMLADIAVSLRMLCNMTMHGTPMPVVYGSVEEGNDEV